jgi:hypothetical protein
MRNQLLLWIFLLLGSAAQAQEGQAALIVSHQRKGQIPGSQHPKGQQSGTGCGA